MFKESIKKQPEAQLKLNKIRLICEKGDLPPYALNIFEFLDIFVLKSYDVCKNFFLLF